MALKWLESFDKYTAGGASIPVNIGTGWTDLQAGVIETTTPRFGDTTTGLQQYLRPPGNGVTWLATWTPNATDDATWVIGMAIKPLTLARIDILGDLNATTHGIILFQADGSIQVQRGNGTVLGTTAPNVWTTNWSYLEILYTLHDSAGVVTLKYDGAQVLNLTGQDTKNGGTNAYLGGFKLLNGAIFDDMYVVNQAAGTGGTTFLGDGRVEMHIPDGAGDTNQFLHGDGSAGSSTNYQEVDERPSYDSDTTYVKSSTLSDQDTYAMENTFASSGNVKGVQLNVVARKDDTANKSIRLVERSSGGAQSDNGADLALSTGYRYYQFCFEDEPGATGWTRSTYDSSKSGQKLVVVS